MPKEEGAREGMDEDGDGKGAGERGRRPPRSWAVVLAAKRESMVVALKCILVVVLVSI